MKKIFSNILFYDKPIAEVFSVEPFDKLELKLLDNRDITMNLLPDKYKIKINNQFKIIDQNQDPIEYIVFLYFAISGSYIRATKASFININTVGN